MKTKLIATVMLLLSITLAFFSMREDSAIMDEVAHLPAGYSYIVKQDMRLNPEHPPLLKDLAGLSVWSWSKITGNKINFPDDHKAWAQDINGQWDFGFYFMFDSGNNADAMLLWGRLPFLLIMLLLGFFVFRWAKELYGDKAALIATLLYAFSPTILAHCRFVTTDVGAAAAFFIALYYFSHWLKNPTWKNTVKAGLIFGLALLAKFSSVLLVPSFVLLALIYVFLKEKEEKLFSRFLNYFGKLLYLGLIGIIFVVIPVYLFHVWHYPVELQQRDISFILNGSPLHFLPGLLHGLSGLPVLRALAQYLFGVAMVFQRAVGGNTTYFLGEVSSSGWKSYFPIVYLIKETLALHLLTLLALIYFLNTLLKRHRGDRPQHRQADLKIVHLDWLKKSFPQFSMLVVIAVYWYSSISANLNIGVRHILPTLPFIFLLVSGQIALWLGDDNRSAKHLTIPLLKKGLVAFVLAFGVASVTAVYPSFLAYFNESIGGPKNGYKYTVDSNLDWGQDLKRLKTWADQNNVDKIYLDYFGGTSPAYYFGNRALEWHGHYSREQMTQSDYLALSATFRQNDLGRLTPSFHDKNGYYQWLEKMEPVSKVGQSIWVYKVK